MNTPLISILMVNYNSEKYLQKTIDSVIAQTYKNWELIIVDDGSTDSCPDIIREYEVQDSRIHGFLMGINQHIASVTNYGFDKLTGSYIARIDSDDVWLNTKLEEQMAFMESNPSASLCFTRLDIIDENDRIINEDLAFDYENYNRRFTDRGAWLRHFFFVGNTLIQSSLLMKRKVLDHLKGFHVAYAQAHDYDFFVRAMAAGFEFIFLEKPLLRYRRYIGQSSSWNDEGVKRFFNEQMFIRVHFFDNMSDQIFTDAFHDYFRNPSSHTPQELQCEQAFLLMRCIRNEDVNPVLGLRQMELLLDDPKTLQVLKEHFNYTPKDFYKEMARPLYMTDVYIDELKNLRDLCPRLNQMYEGAKNENKVILELMESLKGKLAMAEHQMEEQRKQVETLQATITAMENSTSWKITRIFRR